jgi:hypothetical protein
MSTKVVAAFLAFCITAESAWSQQPIGDANSPNLSQEQEPFIFNFDPRRPVSEQAQEALANFPILTDKELGKLNKMQAKPGSIGNYNMIQQGYLDAFGGDLLKLLGITETDVWSWDKLSEYQIRKFIKQKYQLKESEASDRSNELTKASQDLYKQRSAFQRLRGQLSSTIQNIAENYKADADARTGMFGSIKDRLKLLQTKFDTTTADNKIQNMRASEQEALQATLENETSIVRISNYLEVMRSAYQTLRNPVLRGAFLSIYPWSSYKIIPPRYRNTTMVRLTWKIGGGITKWGIDQVAGTLGFMLAQTGIQFLQYIDTGGDDALRKTMWDQFHSSEGIAELVMFGFFSQSTRKETWAAIKGFRDWFSGKEKLPPSALPFVQHASRVTSFGRVSRFLKATGLYKKNIWEWRTGLGMVIGSAGSQAIGKYFTSEGRKAYEQDWRERDFQFIKLGNIRKEISLKENETENARAEAFILSKKGSSAFSIAKVKYDNLNKEKQALVNVLEKTQQKYDGYRYLLFLNKMQAFEAMITNWNLEEGQNLILDSIDMVAATFTISIIKGYMINPLTRGAMKMFNPEYKAMSQTFGEEFGIFQYVMSKITNPVNRELMTRVSAEIAAHPENAEKIASKLPFFKGIWKVFIPAIADWVGVKATKQILPAVIMKSGETGLAMLSGLEFLFASAVIKHYRIQQYEVWELPKCVDEVLGVPPFYKPWKKAGAETLQEQTQHYLFNNADSNERLNNFIGEFQNVDKVCWNDWREKVVKYDLNERLGKWMTLYLKNETSFATRTLFLSWFERVRRPEVLRKDFQMLPSQMIPDGYKDDEFAQNNIGQGAQHVPWHVDATQEGSLVDQYSTTKDESISYKEMMLKDKSGKIVNTKISLLWEYRSIPQSEINNQEKQFNEFENYRIKITKENEHKVTQDLSRMSYFLGPLTERIYFTEIEPPSNWQRSLQSKGLPFNLRSSYLQEAADLGHRMLESLTYIEDLISTRYTELKIPELAQLRYLINELTNKIRNGRDIDDFEIKGFEDRLDTLIKNAQQSIYNEFKKKEILEHSAPEHFQAASELPGLIRQWLTLASHPETSGAAGDIKDLRRSVNYKISLSRPLNVMALHNRMSFLIKAMSESLSVILNNIIPLKTEGKTLQQVSQITIWPFKTDDQIDAENHKDSDIDNCPNEIKKLGQQACANFVQDKKQHTSNTSQALGPKDY